MECTTIRTLPDIVGVECPNKGKPADDVIDCRTCRYYALCWSALIPHLSHDSGQAEVR